VPGAISIMASGRASSPRTVRRLRERARPIDVAFAWLGPSQAVKSFRMLLSPASGGSLGLLWEQPLISFESFANRLAMLRAHQSIRDPFLLERPFSCIFARDPDGSCAW
jgi:hypothetical protein